jgi:hypothetical protein
MITKYNFRSNLRLGFRLILTSSILLAAPAQAIESKVCIKVMKVNALLGESEKALGELERAAMASTMFIDVDLLMNDIINLTNISVR